MLSVDEAQARVRALARTTPVEEVALVDAHRRVLALDVFAARPLPGFDDSAMDGFAVRAADGPGRRPVVGEVAAGALAPAALAPGTALRITTGAPMPAGGDSVVIREEAPEADGWVEIPSARAGANVRRAGEDLALGQRALAAGTLLGPGELGLLAALGIDRPHVARRPRVALLATGDELVDVATTPRPGQRVDSSAYALVAQLVEAGASPRYLGVCPDEPQALAARIGAALPTCDVLLTTGGVSVGARDHVKGVLEGLGATFHFWKVAMKPGKPLAVATVGDTVWFGLPGNPVSSMIALELFVRPMLLAMQGARALARPRVPVILAEGYAKPAGRAHYLRARLEPDGDQLRARALPRQGSGMLTSMIEVDALVEIPAAGTGIPAGGVAWAQLWRAT